MLVIDDEHLLEEPECLRLLGSADIGRLGYTRGALPEVRPVSFTLRDDVLVIPARKDSAALAALTGTVVVLAVDSWAQGGRAADPADGWSVSVVGPIHPAPRSTGGSVSGERVCFLHLRPGIVRGWRVRPSVADPLPA